MRAPLPSAYAEADRRQAVQDLLYGNSFDPLEVPGGPFVLYLCVRDGRLVFDIRDEAEVQVRAVALALGPFRRLIKDYHMIVQSHEQAVTEGGHEARIQAIDMGRRGLHNEGATLLVERLEGPHRPRFRDGAAPLHAGLRAAPADLGAPHP
jgi:uncharacterized protein (UPF0262 family)